MQDVRQRLIESIIIEEDSSLSNQEQTRASDTYGELTFTGDVSSIASAKPKARRIKNSKRIATDYRRFV